MSFITRCPACGTAFRVVADQLKIADGWVRCGRCQHIFDATLDLQPALERTTTAPVAQAPAAAAAAVSPLVPPSDVPASEAPAPAAGAFGSGRLVDSAAQAPQAPSAGEGHTEPAEPRELQPAAAAPDPAAPHAEPDGAVEAPADALAQPSAAPVAGTDEGGLPQVQPAAAAVQDGHMAARASEPEAEPGFVRQARRRAFWRRPVVRLALALIALGLAGGLLGQAAWTWRDDWATRYPLARPALQAFCHAFDCQLAPPRRAQDISIDGSVLLRRAPDRYSFHLVLRNQAEVEVQAPALELTLLDAEERILVRRVWLPHEWPQPTATLGPRSEWPLQFELRYDHPQAARMTGYRAVLFYP
ncbi:zinc-ribbon and DUF3426 domain-containing protein [Tepidimonas charontis]|nr:zinc-ribbon and DUF3426 domain-containing protein [Tepidimonas charontis]